MFFKNKNNKKIFRSEKYRDERPVISVVVPVYNAEEYLKKISNHISSKFLRIGN
ncbi:MAG: hypothetical protein L0L59_08040 [Staphylococcus equorum]|nr:hypothetical protein [Staphylococcus equorum]MDN6843077.1 hypothetical protein [Staphylococcus equorum]MDN6850632.1 hypothetical protein [Staphylococcus equorum]